MRYNVRMRREHRRAICRSCGAVLPGPRGSRVRVRRGKVIISCKKCGQVRRYRLGPPVAKRGTEGDGEGKE
jgi:ribonuclease P protein subunit RPR2